jgi:DNA-directed RNA polymerase subunit M/transcription elongation factor TFIIS
VVISEGRLDSGASLKVYQCPACGFQFLICPKCHRPQKMQLISERLLNNGAILRVYRCPVCGFQFLYQPTIKQIRKDEYTYTRQQQSPEPKYVPPKGSLPSPPHGFSTKLNPPCPNCQSNRVIQINAWHNRDSKSIFCYQCLSCNYLFMWEPPSRIWVILQKPWWQRLRG